MVAGGWGGGRKRRRRRRRGWGSSLAVGPRLGAFRRSTRGSPASVALGRVLNDSTRVDPPPPFSRTCRSKSRRACACECQGGDAAQGAQPQCGRLVSAIRFPPLPAGVPLCERPSHVLRPCEQRFTSRGLGAFLAAVAAAPLPAPAAPGRRRLVASLVAEAALRSHWCTLPMPWICVFRRGRSQVGVARRPMGPGGRPAPCAGARDGGRLAGEGGVYGVGGVGRLIVRGSAAPPPGL